MGKKVTVLNYNPYKVGLNFSDGVKSVVVPPCRNGKPGSISVDEEEINYINSTSSVFSRKILIIKDEEVNNELGYTEKTLANYTDDEIRELIKGGLNKLKSALSEEKEKHVINRVMNIAKEFDDLNMSKVKFLEEWSGMKFEHLQALKDKE